MKHHYSNQTPLCQVSWSRKYQKLPGTHRHRPWSEKSQRFQRARAELGLRTKLEGTRFSSLDKYPVESMLEKKDFQRKEMKLEIWHRLRGVEARYSGWPKLMNFVETVGGELDSGWK